MRRFPFSLLLVATAALLLAACSSPQTPLTNDEVQSPSVVGNVTAAALPVWTGDDNLTVEVLGTGLGNSNLASSTASLVIPDPENVVKVYVQVVTKSGTSGEGTYPDPTSVSIQAFDAGDASLGSASYSGDPEVDTVERVGIESQVGVGGNVGSSGVTGLSHEAGFSGNVAKVEIELSANTITGFPNSPRALIVSVFRDLGDDTTSAGLLPNVYVFGNDGYPDGEQVVELPADFTGGDITVTFAVSDVEMYSRSSGFTANDPRIFYYSARAGGAGATVRQDTPTHGADLAIVELVLSNVPAGTTQVVASLFSPDKFTEMPEGDSIYWNALNVTLSAPPPPEEEEGGTEGCTPGYWRQAHHFDSWTTYAPEQLFSAVFDRVITVRTGGKSTSNDPTLLKAVWAKGGDVNALARHATAALLNSASADVDYPYSTAEVIKAVQDAIDNGGKDSLNAAKDLLASANELGCPLN